MATAISALVSRIMQTYDANQDGVIDLTSARTGGRGLPDESFRETASTFSDGDMVVTTSEIYSRAPLFLIADANQDRRVTPEELTHVIALFDKNRDGALGTEATAVGETEAERFEHDYPEVLVSQSRFARLRQEP